VTADLRDHHNSISTMHFSTLPHSLHAFIFCVWSILPVRTSSLVACVTPHRGWLGGHLSCVSGYRARIGRLFFNVFLCRTLRVAGVGGFRAVCLIVVVGHPEENGTGTGQYIDFNKYDRGGRQTLQPSRQNQAR